MLSKADVVPAEDDLFKLRTHDRYPLLNFSALKSCLREVLFKEKICDIAQAMEMVLFAQRFVDLIVTPSLEASNLQQIFEMLKYAQD